MKSSFFHRNKINIPSKYDNENNDYIFFNSKKSGSSEFLTNEKIAVALCTMYALINKNV